MVASGRLRYQRVGIVVAVCVLCLQTLSTDAAIYWVSKTEDTQDGACDADCSLREAIKAANSNPGFDTVSVPAGTYSLTIEDTGGDENGCNSGDLDIWDGIFIGGAGAGTTIIDALGPASNYSRVFDIHGPFSGIVSIYGVTVTGGDLHDSGGGIKVDNASLVLSSVRVFDNETDMQSGGAIYCANGELTIQQGSRIDSNRGKYSGGILTVNCDLTVDESVIANNVAQTHGGGIEMGGPYNLTVTDSTIIGNHAPRGGGMSLGSIVGTITLSTISYNSATSDTGGGIETTGTLELVNSSVYGNSAVTSGGGIFVGTIGAVALHSVTLSGNSAAVGPSIGSSGSVTLTNTLMSGGCGGSGGVYITNGGNVLQGDNTCGLSSTFDTYGVGDLMLSEPAFAGGLTRVLLPEAGSPAIGNGTDDYCLAVDQRGQPRSDLQCDAGAVERQPIEPLLFADSFESGTTGSWNQVAPR